MRRLKAAFLVVLWGLCIVELNALADGGHFVAYSNWKFFHRFCFDDTDGVCELTVQYTKNNYGVQSILFYYDNENSWDVAYPSNNDNENSLYDDHLKEKVSCDKQYKGSVHVADLRPSSYNCVDSNPHNLSSIVTCRIIRYFRTSRVRWWYLAVSACPSDRLDFEYEVTFLNGNSFFSKHFSADVKGTLETDLVVLIALLLLLVVFFKQVRILQKKHLYHKMLHFLQVSFIVEVVSEVVSLIHYLQYARNGRGVPTFLIISDMFHLVAHIIYLIVIMTLAKGWSIARGMLSGLGALKIALFISAYGLVSIGVLIWSRVGFNKAEVTYIMESPAGKGLIVLHLIALGLFIRNCIISTKMFPKRKTFFLLFMGLISLWFLAMPVTTLFAWKVIDKWARARIVNGVEKGAVLYSYAVLMMFWRPHWASDFFPFIQTGNQVGMMPMSVEDCDVPPSIPNAFAAEPGQFPGYDVE